ncbi:unnamed protein product [Rotaria sp. Silwood2]|nr:unnamed protein product [Rotaria sp. Silwood2]CAF2970835.1 unnamed protein product [Rotaria sp. Silwood2]CAF3314339.1 unnamed protein product [Rotaria sp. Silwood2]CAF3328779.1 unnamed protein product [Rotaria sp. Silwood2]CAF4300439.1 unnamed protein product [Rotaria sp. Silwood2]
MNLVLEKQQQDMIDNRFTVAYLKRAISNNLPCFYIQFEEDLNSGQLPLTRKVAHILNQFFSNKWEPSFKGFTIYYRFAITDLNEYYAALNLGRVAICNQLFPLTPFRSGYKMTYCSKCWKLRHTRDFCSEQSRCRICLAQFENDVQHNCLGTPKCAQCNEAHWSLDNKCAVVKQYRYDLKKAVNDAIITRKISKDPSNENKRPFISMQDDFPVLKHVSQEIKSTI